MNEQLCGWWFALPWDWVLIFEKLLIILSKTGGKVCPAIVIKRFLKVWLSFYSHKSDFAPISTTSFSMKWYFIANTLLIIFQNCISYRVARLFSMFWYQILSVFFLIMVCSIINPLLISDFTFQTQLTMTFQINSIQDKNLYFISKTIFHLFGSLQMSFFKITQFLLFTGIWVVINLTTDFLIGCVG